MNRKSFLFQSATAGAALIANPFSSFSQTKKGPEPYKTEIVKEFVGAGHGKPDRVHVPRDSL